jgi:NAD-dependent dihydropyrimidine dehydrogenase PreA subunit
MKLKNMIRLILQLIVLVMVIIAVIRITDVEAYCPLGGFLSIGSRLVHGTSSCQMSETQMFLGVALILAVLIIGKLFCAHVCPIGTVTEWLGRWGRKFKIQIKRLPDFLDRGLRSLKYLLLLPVLYYTTTSSELFCKTFDPYYAATTGFGLDVIWWWALPALIITVIGSLVLRQFWCKYLCPLGALSNLFQFALFTIGSFLIYVLLQIAGMTLSVFWLFLLWAIGGFLLETFYRRSVFIPFVRIRRESSTCIDCGLCDKVCPYDIKVSTAEVVTHIDCTMCVDCIAVCPVKDCLTLKPANWKHLPAFATVALVAISLSFSSRYEISTLSERWGEKNVPVHLSSYQTVVKSVKCFGTASSFKRKIERYKGIYGMDAYATSHKVVLYYNPAEIDSTGIKKAVFSPYKNKLRSFKEKLPKSLKIVYFGVENLNDNIDNVNFVRVLHQSSAIYGFESDFGEPVRVLVYYDEEAITPEEMIKLIEARRIVYRTPQGETNELDLNFNVRTGPEILGEIDTQDFLQHIFNPFVQKFSTFKTVPPDSILILETGMPGLENPQVRRFLPYLASHISQNDGILGIETFYSQKPLTWIYYHPALADTGAIMDLIRNPRMTVTFSSGDVREFDNPFQAKPPFLIRSMPDILKEKNDLQKKMAFLKVFQSSDEAEEPSD